MITVDRTSALPLTDQIVQQFIRISDEGGLVAGMRLPSIRQCAERVGVSTYTVVIAYDRLVALGRVVSEASSGFFVAGTTPSNLARAPQCPDAEGVLDAIWLTRCAAETDDNWVAAGSGTLPGHWLEDVTGYHLVPRIWRSVSDQPRPDPAQGLLALREALSVYLRKEKIFVDPRHIITTAGATQALDLICRAMLQPGDCVVVENPTYPMLLSRLRQEQITILPVARGPEGIDVDMLAQLCERHVPKMVFTQSALHNPTGFSSSISNNHRLLSLAERYRFMIAEDDTYGDLAQGTPSRLAQLSSASHIIYYRSFGKAMGMAGRVGFIAASAEVTALLQNVKIHSVARCSPVDERIVLTLLQGGRYRKHTERLAHRLKIARVTAMKALRGSGLRFHPEAEGMFLWTEIAPGMDMDALVRDACRHQILLAPGHLFSAQDSAGTGTDIDTNPTYARYLRLNVAFAHHVRLVEFLATRLQAAPAPTGRNSALALLQRYEMYGAPENAAPCERSVAEVGGR